MTVKWQNISALVTDGGTRVLALATFWAFCSERAEEGSCNTSQACNDLRIR